MHADAPDALRWLRVRGERPCRRATDQRDESAPPHEDPQVEMPTLSHRRGSKTALCTTAKLIVKRSLRVPTGPRAVTAWCPLYPRKRRESGH